MTEQAYDNINNEGGDGYNPIREARERAEIEAIQNAPRTRIDILDDIERYDSSIALESGTYDEARVAALQQELADFDAKEEAEFKTVWTADVTAARRAEWNEWVKSQGAKVDARALVLRQHNQGWTIDQLKKAVALYK